MAAVLAMLYLILFAVMALGFYAIVNTSVQVAASDRDALRAFTAAESGMDFMRYHLARLRVPPGTSPDDILIAVGIGLAERLEGTGNFAGGPEAAVGLDETEDLLSIPADPQATVALSPDGLARFRASIGLGEGQRLTVTVTGRWGSGLLRRSIQMQYSLTAAPSLIFDYGIASRSPIEMSGNTVIRGLSRPAAGSVLSTTDRTPTLRATGNNRITGDVFLTNPAGTVSLIGNNSIGTVHKGVEAPEFPIVDASPFEPYAVNPITASTIAGNTTLSNIRIRANSNTNFLGNVTINGVVFIETPNRIRFSGNLNLTGVIVAQNNPTGDVNSNSIDFAGNVTFRGPEQLPASYGGLRELTGSMLLAPNFTLKMQGNFGTIGGSIVVGKTEMTGNAGGVIRGSLINLEDTAFTLAGNTNLAFDPDNANRNPAGMRFAGHYLPVASTYSEPAE